MVKDRDRRPKQLQDEHPLPTTSEVNCIWKSLRVCVYMTWLGKHTPFFNTGSGKLTAQQKRLYLHHQVEFQHNYFGFVSRHDSIYSEYLSCVL